MLEPVPGRQTLGGAIFRFPHGTWNVYRRDGTVKPTIARQPHLLEMFAWMESLGHVQARLSTPIRWGENGAVLVEFPAPDGWLPILLLKDKGDEPRSIDEAEEAALYQR